MACLVPNCSGGKHLLRHALPKNNKLRRDWLLALNREDLIGKQFREVYTLKVCRKHFLPTSYRTSEGVCLNTNAMPIPVPKTEILESDKMQKNSSGGKKYTCLAKGCGAIMKKTHRLPIRKDARNLWLKNLGREELIDLPMTTLKHRNVCEAHFKPSDFTFPGSGRLIRKAVPIPVERNLILFSCHLSHKLFKFYLATDEIVEEKIDEPIEDEIIATGEVTAPKLCHNKMLLKTKCTYSKNKYEMTFKDVTPLPSIVDSEIIEDEDENFEDELLPSLPETDTTKIKVDDININNNKKRKFSETLTEEEINKIEENDTYDDKLLSFMQELGSLPKFLDVIFGFLYRRTDYYEITSEANPGVGLPEGVAQKLLWEAFKKYETPKVPTVEDPMEVIPPPICEKLDTLVDTSVEIVQTPIPTTIKTVKTIKTIEPIKDKSEVRLFKTVNGAVFENYAWSQAINNVDIQIIIPDKISCKQLQIDISASDLLIKQRNTDIIYLKGELCNKCKVNETVWSLGGHILQIHLEKDSEGWWDCLLRSEPRLDFNKMDFIKLNLEEIVVKEEVTDTF